MAWAFAASLNRSSPDSARCWRAIPELQPLAEQRERVAYAASAGLSHLARLAFGLGELVIASRLWRGNPGPHEPIWGRAALGCHVANAPRNDERRQTRMPRLPRPFNLTERRGRGNASCNNELIICSANCPGDARAEATRLTFGSRPAQQPRRRTVSAAIRHPASPPPPVFEDIVVGQEVGPMPTAWSGWSSAFATRRAWSRRRAAPRSRCRCVAARRFHTRSCRPPRKE